MYAPGATEADESEVVEMEFEFTFVVSGVNVHDDELVAILLERLDAILAKAAGATVLTVAIDGINAIDAARNAALECTELVPKLRLIRLDRDLVGAVEIAERTGRSLEDVTQWVSGEKHLGLTPFPTPEGVVARTRVWLWTEVNDWLRQLDLNDVELRPSREEMTAIDDLLRTDRLIESSKHTRRVSRFSGRAKRPKGVAAVKKDCLGLARDLILDRTAARTRDRIRDIRIDFSRAVSLVERLEILDTEPGHSNPSGTLMNSTRMAERLSRELAKAGFSAGRFEQLGHLDSSIDLAMDLLMIVADDDFRGLDISGLDFSGKDLSDADLEGATMSGVVWNAQTKWPDGLLDVIRSKSIEISPGVFRIEV